MIMGWATIIRRNELDLMLAIKDDAVNNDQRITHEYFISKTDEFLKESIQPFFDKHIENGKLYNLTKIFKEFEYEFSPTTKVYDLGFTFSKDQKNVADIDKNSNAYKTGLRKGDQILGRNLYHNNPDFEAKFKVKRGQKEFVFKYFPFKLANFPHLIDNEQNKKKLPF